MTVVERDALGRAGGAGGLQPHHLVVDMGMEVDRRVMLVGAVDIGFIEDVPLGDGEGLAEAVHRDDHLGLVSAHFDRLQSGRCDLRVVEIDLRAVVRHDLGSLARREVEVDRIADGAELLRGDVAEQKLGRVEELEHHDVALAHAVRLHGVGEAVALGIQLGVCPLLLFRGGNDGGLVAEAAHVAQKAVQPSEFGFKGFSEHGGVIGEIHNYLPVFRCVNMLIAVFSE